MNQQEPEPEPEPNMWDELGYGVKVFTLFFLLFTIWVSFAAGGFAGNFIAGICATVFIIVIFRL